MPKGRWRACIMEGCGAPAADDCDEMICGHLCTAHLNEWSPWGGSVQEAWEGYCQQEMPRQEVRA